MKTQNTSITLAQKFTKALNQLPNPSAILTSRKATIDIFHKTAKQGDIFPAIQSFKDGICRLQPTLTGSSIDFFSDFLNEIDMRTFMRAALTARDYGFAVLEITEYREFKGKTIPYKIELCPIEMFGFDTDRKLRLYSTKEKNGVIVDEIYPNKFICIQNEPTLVNPYGIGILDIAYWYAVGLNGNFEFMMTFAEDDGRDKLLGKHSPDATDGDIDNLLSMLVQLRNNSVAAIPNTMDIDKIENQNRGSSRILYKDIDEILRRKIEKLFYGTDLTMQVAGKGGYSSSQSGLEIRGEALSSGCEIVKMAVYQLLEMCANINNLTLPLDANFELVAPKKLTKEEAEIDQIYFKMGMKPTAEFFESRGYDPNHFTVVEKNETVETHGRASQQFHSDFEANQDTDDLLSCFDTYRKQLIKKK